jgi:hypothetical protein
MNPNQAWLRVSVINKKTNFSMEEKCFDEISLENCKALEL